MGWLDKAKVMLGIIDEEDLADEGAPRADPNRRRKPGERPSLDGIEAAPQQSIEDALQAREAGDLDGMRQLLRDMDRGAGLRTVLRAAAALEAEAEDELAPLLGKVVPTKQAWKLPLQVAAALRGHSASDSAARAERLQSWAENHNAPRWALAWSQATANDEITQRHGLVELLFAEPGLARTIAARDLELPDVEADASATERYASFAHGRDCVRRFDADIVAQLLERALKLEGAAS